MGDLIFPEGLVSIDKYAFYGHLHGIHPPLEHNGVTYLNQAVGVRNKRINEWQQDDFTAQWQSSLRILDL